MIVPKTFAFLKHPLNHPKISIKLPRVIPQIIPNNLCVYIETKMKSCENKSHEMEERGYKRVWLQQTRELSLPKYFCTYFCLEIFWERTNIWHICVNFLKIFFYTSFWNTFVNIVRVYSCKYKVKIKITKSWKGSVWSRSWHRVTLNLYFAFLIIHKKRIL